MPPRARIRVPVVLAVLGHVSETTKQQETKAMRKNAQKAES